MGYEVGDRVALSDDRSVLFKVGLDGLEGAEGEVIEVLDKANKFYPLGVRYKVRLDSGETFYIRPGELRGSPQEPVSLGGGGFLFTQEDTQASFEGSSSLEWDEYWD